MVNFEFTLLSKVEMTDMFLGKKLEIKAKKEVKSRQASPAWNKESFQREALNNCFLLMRTFTEI